MYKDLKALVWLFVPYTLGVVGAAILLHPAALLHPVVTAPLIAAMIKVTCVDN